MLTALDDAGKLDDTLVLISSDHGENFGEGGLLGHAYSLDERLLHVPFIASGPNAPDEMKSLVELPRVIADAVGLESHPWDREGPAVAVAQFDSPGERDDPRKLEAVEAWGAGPEALDEPVNAIMECAVRGETKLVRRDGELQLFDLADDPLEERPRVVARERGSAGPARGDREPVCGPRRRGARRRRERHRLSRGARPHRGADADARIPLRLERFNRDTRGNPSAWRMFESTQKAYAMSSRSATACPTSPASSDKSSWWQAIKRTVKEFKEDNLTDWAAALTYYGDPVDLPRDPRAGLDPRPAGQRHDPVPDRQPRPGRAGTGAGHLHAARSRTCRRTRAPPGSC